MATKFEKHVKTIQNQQKQTIPNNINMMKMIFSLDAHDTLNLIQEQHLANWNLKLLL
jgi:UDP-galactopyranose mutase